MTVNAVAPAPLLHQALRLDGNGRAVIDEIPEPAPFEPNRAASSALVWLHFDRSANAKNWVAACPRLDELVKEALLDEVVRPRAQVFEDGLLVILRGVNLNPGADPEEMVSVRLWIERGWILSLRARRVMGLAAIHERLLAGKGPHDAGAFLVDLAGGLIDRMRPVVDELEEEVGRLHEAILAGKAHHQRSALTELRASVIELRRHMAPQREALQTLQRKSVRWLTDDHRAEFTEIADQLTRLLEDLETISQRATIAYDEHTKVMAEQLNRNMYLMSLVAAVFLPLSLFTGLLGINVAGIPGADSRLAFAVVCALLIVLALAMLWVLKRLRVL
jgi:zinc transporter